MNILIDIGHPAHVHFFKHSISELNNLGHHVFIVARKKDVTIELLDEYGFDYEYFTSAKKGLISLGKELVEHSIKLYRFAKKNKIEIMLNIGGTFIVHPGLLLGIPTIVFSDTEHAKISNSITYPFATKICTPNCYFADLGKKQVKYDGYHELAYLHPNRFNPDESVLSELGIEKTDRFFIVRFVSWGASHDKGQWGFSLEQKKELVTKLSKYGRVLISSEGDLSDEFIKYKFSLSPTKIHHLLAYCNLYIGEGATMATESAILGTPSIYVNSLTAGTIEELINKYQMLYRYTDGDEAISKAIELVENSEAKLEQLRKRDKFLLDKIDVTNWLTEFVNTYGKKTI
jgi:hypothetical protein